MKVYDDISAQEFRDKAWSGAADTLEDLTDEQMALLRTTLDDLIIVKQNIHNKDEIHTFKGYFIPDLVDDINTVNGRDYISKVKVLNDLKITRGAMILDGYDCYDSCIKYMDELIEKYNEYSK